MLCLELCHVSFILLDICHYIITSSILAIIITTLKEVVHKIQFFIVNREI